MATRKEVSRIRTVDEPDPAMFERVTEAVGGADDVALPNLREALPALLRVYGTSREAAFASTQLALDAVQIVLGRSTVEPKRGDWRFRHPAWSGNPGYRLLSQLYLAWADAVTDVVERVETKEWRTKEQARFLTGILTSALAPTNLLLGNPAALERAFQTGGASLLSGLQNFLRDQRDNGGMPTQADTSGFKVGQNMAVSPGAVVFRNEICEVIQYRPAGDSVRARPVLVVPPPIGKYYFLDLAPGRSFFEYVVSRGLQLFTISWRNPGPEHGSWNFDDYAGAVLEAIDVARDVGRSKEVNALGFCAGGLLLTTVLNHLAARGDKRVNTASFAVMLLDFDTPAAIGTFSPRAILSTARTASKHKGVLEKKNLSAVFAWLRPNDLVWNYWVNNYLMGDRPPAVDLMAWNVDGTNLPAALHSQFLEIFGENALCKPGEFSVLGTPVDLANVRHENYCMAAIADHLTPWKGCYRATQLLNGDSTFVLSNSGHIAGLVNPPGNPKAKYFAGPRPGSDPDSWLAEATERPGTWWEHWADWVSERAGDMRDAPEALGSARHPALQPAPGSYIFG